MRTQHEVEGMQFAVGHVMDPSPRREAYSEVLAWVLGGEAPLDVFGADAPRDPTDEIERARQDVMTFLLIHCMKFDREQRAHMLLCLGVLEWAATGAGAFKEILDLVRSYDLGPVRVK